MKPFHAMCEAARQIRAIFLVHKAGRLETLQRISGKNVEESILIQTKRLNRGEAVSFRSTYFLSRLERIMLSNHVTNAGCIKIVSNIFSRGVTLCKEIYNIFFLYCKTFIIAI